MQQVATAGSGGAAVLINGTVPGPNGTFGIVGPNGSSGPLSPQLAPLLRAVQEARSFNDSKAAV